MIEAVFGEANRLADPETNITAAKGQ